MASRLRPWRFMRLTLFAIASPLWCAGCAGNPDRLPELDRRFYHNLSDPTAQQQFLKLDEEERQAFLETQGLWPQWAALSEEERDAAVTGTVKPGYRAFQVFMAWGPPADTRVRNVRGRSVQFHTFIRCTSGPKVGRYVKNNLECDGTSSEKNIAVENDIVTEINHPD